MQPGRNTQLETKFPLTFFSKRLALGAVCALMLGGVYGCGDDDEKPPVTTNPPYTPPPANGPGDDSHLTALTLELTDSTTAVAPLIDGFSIPAVFTAKVGGFKNAADAADVKLKISSMPGMKITSNTGTFQGDTKTFSVTVEHNGSNTLECKSDTIHVELETPLPAGYRYSDGAKPTQILIRTGEKKDCPILVNQANIATFNSYARTTQGLKRHYQLIEDVTLREIDANGNTWVPIGSYLNKDDNEPFTGSFDGGGKTISNLVIYRTNGDYLGLFSYISRDVEIENLGLKNVKIDHSGYGYYIGSLVGWMERGTVRNCYAEGTVESNNEGVGGLVGAMLGGLVENAFASGSVSSAGWGVGGLVGQVGNGTGTTVNATVRNCYTTNNVTMKNSFTGTGGVVGYNQGTVQNCYSTGTVKGYRLVGGVVGNNNGGTLTNCYSTAEVISSENGAGGIASSEPSVSPRIQNCVALNSSVTVTNNNATANGVGRISGHNNTNQHLLNNYARDDMKVYFGTNQKTDFIGGTDKMDGQAVSKDGAAGYGNSSFWENLCFGVGANKTCWDFEKVWDWGDNNLPILINVGGKQDHKVQ